jgi:2-keto-4-pentenoate hydratase
MTASEVPPRLVAALRAQLARRPSGARRVGWKIGADIAEVEEVTGGGPAIGSLTSATLLGDGDRYDARGAALHADTELVLVLGRDVGAEDDVASAVAAVGVAVELVDLARPPGGLEGIVAANVFHRAFALGPAAPQRPYGDARSVVNGEVRAGAPARVDHEATVSIVARLLAAAGERLQRGDRILAGSLTQVAVRPGDTVAAEVDGIGRVAVTIGR